jgi:hypothetical protein
MEFAATTAQSLPSRTPDVRAPRVPPWDPCRRREPSTRISLTGLPDEAGHVAREAPGDDSPRRPEAGQWVTGGVTGAMAEVSRGAGMAGWSAFEASGFPPLPPLHAAAGPSSATVAATIVKDRLMLIASSGFRGWWRRLHLACL